MQNHDFTSINGLLDQDFERACKQAIAEQNHITLRGRGLATVAERILVACLPCYSILAKGYQGETHKRPLRMLCKVVFHMKIEGRNEEEKYCKLAWAEISGFNHDIC